MFSDKETKISGKHLICDFKNVDDEIIHDINKVKEVLDSICEAYEFTVLNRVEHIFQPQGFTLLYLLSESHLSVHTFPERKTIAFDLYTCRPYKDDMCYKEIHLFLTRTFRADLEIPQIIDRELYNEPTEKKSLSMEL
jgi:S-adenosylmethionine decarboxylase